MRKLYSGAKYEEDWQICWNTEIIIFFYVSEEKSKRKEENLRELCHTQLVKRVSWSKGVWVPNPKTKILNPKSRIRSLIPNPKSPKLWLILWEFENKRKKTVLPKKILSPICLGSERKLWIFIYFFGGWGLFG